MLYNNLHIHFQSFRNFKQFRECLPSLKYVICVHQFIIFKHTFDKNIDRKKEDNYMLLYNLNKIYAIIRVFFIRLLPTYHKCLYILKVKYINTTHFQEVVLCMVINLFSLLLQYNNRTQVYSYIFSIMMPI